MPGEGERGTPGAALAPGLAGSSQKRQFVKQDREQSTQRAQRALSCLLTLHPQPRRGGV